VLVGTVALAVGDQLELVLTGEGRVPQLLGRKVETDRWKPAPLQPKDAACPQLDLDAAGVGSATVPQGRGVVFALRAAIAK